MNINSFFRFFLLLLAMTSLVSLQAKDVSRYSLPKTKAETIVLECPIGKSAFVNPEDAQALGKGEILSIDYVFSSYFKGDFSQSNLDRQRIDNLHALLPKTEASELDLFRQTACSERDCASNLLHGFVITYRPGTVLSANNLEVQKFNYESTSVSNTFITEGGMSVHVPAYAFEDLHGKAVKGEIDLEVREALDDESILIAGLKTVTSKGDVLRSGGMFEVEASKDGRTLRLRKNKELTIIVPTKQLDPEMQLYTGVMDDGELSWTNPTSLNTKDIESQVDSISWDNNEIETVVSIDSFSLSGTGIVWSTTCGCALTKRESSSPKRSTQKKWVAYLDWTIGSRKQLKSGLKWRKCSLRQWFLRCLTHLPRLLHLIRMDCGERFRAEK